MSRKIIVEKKYFGKLLEKYQAAIRSGVDDSDVHFYSWDGKYILQYHASENIIGATTEPINLKFE